MAAKKNASALPRQSFAQAFDSKNNSFGFLRLTLAILVIFSHSFPLGGFGRDPLQVLAGDGQSFGLLAVSMFFALSGFLICRSASSSTSILRFLWHRFLRIFPAYWGCLFFCAFIFAPLVAYMEFGTLLGVFSVPKNSPQSFLFGNVGLFHLNGFSIGGVLAFQPESIAGLLQENPYPRAINGSLWTLPFEIACYLGLAALATVGILRRVRFLVFALFAGLWCLHALARFNQDAFRRCFPQGGSQELVMLSLFFFAGCVAFLYREKIPHSRAAFIFCIAASGLSLSSTAFTLIASIAMTYALLWLAFTLPFARFEQRGDFSYGTYIYAFPVQQGFALLGVQSAGFIPYFACSVLLTLVLAFLSYRLIEAPCLRLKSMTWTTFRISRERLSRWVTMSPSNQIEPQSSSVTDQLCEDSIAFRRSR